MTTKRRGDQFSRAVADLAEGKGPWAAKPQTVTEHQKRQVECPKCAARPGHACRGSRIPGPNTFGGGWGGPPNLERAHPERRTAYITAQCLRALRVLKDAMELRAKFPNDALTRLRLAAALTAYEASGDHNHGNGPIGIDGACPGGDCLVAQARAALAQELAAAEAPLTPLRPMHVMLRTDDDNA